MCTHPPTPQESASVGRSETDPLLDKDGGALVLGPAADEEKDVRGGAAFYDAEEAEVLVHYDDEEDEEEGGSRAASVRKVCVRAWVAD